MMMEPLLLLHNGLKLNLHTLLFLLTFKHTVLLQEETMFGLDLFKFQSPLRAVKQSILKDQSLKM